MANEPPASNFIFASLSVILLSMFVLLNSLATRDQTKEMAALVSVKEALDAPQSWQKSLLAELAPRLRNDIAPFGGTITEDQEKLILSLDKNILFRDEDIQINARALPILQNIAAAVQSSKLKIDIRYVSSPAGLTSAWEKEWSIALNRTSAMFRFFVDSEIAEQFVTASSIGTDPANQSKVLIILRSQGQGRSHGE